MQAVLLFSVMAHPNGAAGLLPIVYSTLLPYLLCTWYTYIIQVYRSSFTSQCWEYILCRCICISPTHLDSVTSSISQPQTG